MATQAQVVGAAEKFNTRQAAHSKGRVIRTGKRTSVPHTPTVIRKITRQIRRQFDRGELR